MNFKVLLLVLIAIEFAYDLMLSILKITSSKRPVPEIVNDVYDKDTYQKWLKYSKESSTLSIVEKVVNFLIMFFLILFNFFTFIGSLVLSNYAIQIIVISLTYIGVNFVTSIIFDSIRDFYVEAKYGFNTTKVKTFISDTILGTLLSCAIQIIPILFFAFVYESLSYWAILICSVALVLFILLINFLFPYLAKIYNKFTPLEDGELKTKLMKLMSDNGFTITGIFIVDASKRSTKENAYFTGFGKSKRIVIYDTMINKITSDEIVAVFAHELGHAKHKDVLKSTPISILESIMYVVVLFLCVYFKDIYLDFGFTSLNYGFALIVFMYVVTPLEFIISLFTNYLSRKHEYAADNNGVSSGYGKELISSLKKLTHDNFGLLNPNPFLQFLVGTHPTLVERIDNINSQISKTNNKLQ